MKAILTLALALIFFKANAQTKILDTSVNWSKGTLTVYLTDSLATSVSIQLGTSFQAHDVFNQPSLILGEDLPFSNTLVIPLTGVSSGIYYVDVKVTSSDASIQEMELQTSN